MVGGGADMTNFVETLKDNWIFVAQAPWAFLVLASVSVLISWIVSNHLSSNKITDLEARLKLRDDEIGDYKRKLSGASPNEAKALIEQLERRVDALSPRRFSTEQRQAITKVVSPGNGKGISIAADAASADASNIQRGLAAAFATSGWAVMTPMVMGLQNPLLSGVGLSVVDPAALTPDELRIADALQAAGLEFDLQLGGGIRQQIPGRPPTVAELTITNRALD